MCSNCGKIRIHWSQQDDGSSQELSIQLQVRVTITSNYLRDPGQQPNMSYHEIGSAENSSSAASCNDSRNVVKGRS